MKRILFAFGLLVSTVAAGEVPELRPLKGEKFQGALVSVSDKQIVLKVGAEDRAIPTEQTLGLDFRAVEPLREARYSEVVLADRSVLRCATVEMKGKEVVLGLLGGHKVVVPLAAVTSVLKEGQDTKTTAASKALVADKKRSYDTLVVKSSAGVLNPLEGTFGEASADGKQIAFTPKGGEKREILLERLHGLFFLRPPDPNLPPLLCRVQDTMGNILMARSVVLQGDKFQVISQVGARGDLPTSATAKLDYSGGKLTYLSDFELARVQVDDERAKRLKGVEPFFRRDSNLVGDGPMRLGGESFPKGIVMCHGCEVTFVLDGEYRELRTIVGFDDRVSRAYDGPVNVRFDGDGKELKTLRVTQKEGRQPVSLNLIDVNKLRIIVSCDFPLPFGAHVDLADAKVSK